MTDLRHYPPEQPSSAASIPVLPEDT
jgi:hypothetical protein